MPQRKKTIGVIFILFLTLGVGVSLITSCNNDNPVNPSQNISILDSNVFDWEIDTVNIELVNDFYICDTNKIFVPGYPYSVFKNGNAMKYIDHNDQDFGATCSNGTDVNNIYIGGGSLSSNRSKLKKWNGVSIEEIPLPVDPSNGIVRIEPVTQNDIWLSTGSNIIYRYLNNSIIRYCLDSNLNYGRIYRDDDENLFVQFLEHPSDTFGTSLYMYKFINGSWTKIWKDTFEDNSEMGHFMGFINHTMLRSGKSSIYYFTGNSWEKYVNFGNDINPLWNAGGDSPVNILFDARQGYQSYTFYYNGKQLFRIPYNEITATGHDCIQYAYGRYYITANNNMYQNYFAIAKLKTSNIKK